MMRQKDFKYSYFLIKLKRVYQQRKDLNNDTIGWECTRGRKVGMGMGRWGDISFSLKNISSWDCFGMKKKNYVL